MAGRLGSLAPIVLSALAAVDSVLLTDKFMGKIALSFEEAGKK